MEESYTKIPPTLKVNNVRIHQSGEFIYMLMHLNKLKKPTESPTKRFTLPNNPSKEDSDQFFDEQRSICRPTLLLD